MDRPPRPARTLLTSDGLLPLDAPFTLNDAQALGVSRQQLRSLLAAHSVRRVVRGVYAAAQAPDDVFFRAAALARVLPADAVATDRTAAWLHGVDLLPRSSRETTPPLQVFRPPGRRARRTGVASGERALLPRDVVRVGTVRATSPVRTALDLSRLVWRFDALAALDQFVRSGVRIEELLTELDRFRGYRGVVQARALVPLADGRAESVAESVLRLHWYDAGLPPPEPQSWVQDERGIERYRLDLALPDVRFAAEYDGAEFHSSTEQREHDLHRRRWLDEHAGWTVEVFVNDDLFRPFSDPAPRLRDGLRRARARLGHAPWTP
ncbi:type IV toxin-antitoxin system AbiEi family antitoxin [Nocardioides sp.]|uniref:type IV toxin-antitoxin system AbiEi family antitoxin n=1 Tax=Nocardioides sp. TaxID=35761 RepID=UPI0035656A1B